MFVARASLGCALALACNVGLASSYVEAILFHKDSKTNNFLGYESDFSISIDSSITDVTSVSLLKNGTSVPLDHYENGWDFQPQFATLDELKTSLSTPWTVQVVHGGNTSTLNFTLNLASVTQASFPAIPSISDPTNGSVLAPGSHTFQWSDPDAASSVVRMADLDRYAGSFVQYQFDASTFSWTTDLVGPDLYKLSVQYAWVGSQDLLSGVSSTGPLVWGKSPFAPADWTDGYPLVAYVGSQDVGFAVPEPTSLGLLGIAGLLLSRRSRS